MRYQKSLKLRGRQTHQDNLNKKNFSRHASERSELAHKSGKIFLDGFIQKIKNSGRLIIVEGKKDKKALESLGFSDIIELNSMPLYKIIELISKTKKDCILLTDLDKEGKKIFGKLSSGLQKFGVKTDNTFREFLFRNTKLRQIEGLHAYFDELD